MISVGGGFEAVVSGLKKGVYPASHRAQRAPDGRLCVRAVPGGHPVRKGGGQAQALQERHGTPGAWGFVVGVFWASVVGLDLERRGAETPHPHPPPHPPSLLSQSSLICAALDGPMPRIAASSRTAPGEFSTSSALSAPSPATMRAAVLGPTPLELVLVLVLGLIWGLMMGRLGLAQRIGVSCVKISLSSLDAAGQEGLDAVGALRGELLGLDDPLGGRGADWVASDGCVRCVMGVMCAHRNPHLPPPHADPPAHLTCHPCRSWLSHRPRTTTVVPTMAVGRLPRRVTAAPGGRREGEWEGSEF
jgi:hypothetical protein